MMNEVSEKEKWRLMMWENMLHATPARVIIDLERQSYRVEDNSFRYIYADDIEETEINTIVEEWAELMRAEDREKFAKTFSPKALNEAFENQHREISMRTKMNDKTIVTNVRFGCSTRAMIMEFTFRTIQADAE